MPHFSVSVVRGEGAYVHTPHAATVRVGIKDGGVDLTRKVFATLALMKDRFRGQLGNVELVKRLIATADDSLHEDDDPSHDGITSVVRVRSRRTSSDECLGVGSMCYASRLT